MSMSSMIEDLPGPQDNLDLQHNEMKMQQNEMMQINQNEMQEKEIQESEMQRIENFEEKSTPIKLEIKKKGETGPSILDTIKSEFNFNNLIIIVALYIACIPEANVTIRKGLSMFSNSAYSHFIVTIIKCIVLLIIIILVKNLYIKM